MSKQIVTLSYTGHGNEEVKGVLFYDDYKLVEVYLHPTFVAEYWLDAKFKIYMSTPTANKESVIKTVEDSNLIKRELNYVPIKYHAMCEVEL